MRRGYEVFKRNDSCYVGRNWRAWKGEGICSSLHEKSYRLGLPLFEVGEAFGDRGIDTW